MTQQIIITTTPLTRSERHRITDIAFEINLKYDTNFSTLVVDREAWTLGPVSVLPVHEDILKEGISLL